MGLNETPSGERVHIGFFGQRRPGKSSGQCCDRTGKLAVVSDTRGTNNQTLSARQWNCFRSGRLSS